MASLFDGTKDRDDIGEIFRLMNDNCPAPSSTSRKLWKLRWATDIKLHNVSGEKMLEKAVAMLARNGHMPGWFNQCPAASGIGDSSRYRQSNVDLVHWGEADGRARLVELKWGSDSPSAAVRQVLRYGAAYVFCRVHRKHLNVDSRPIMNARQVLLQVVAPARYGTEPGLLDCLSRAREGLKRFEIGSGMEELSMSLDVLAFPDWFDRLPYSDGAEVRAGCDRKELTDTGRQIREAFDNLTSVHPGAGWAAGMTGRFLPGVPGPEIEAIFEAAPGNEIATGKLDSLESSAALAANAFGFFLNRASGLPLIPGCEGETWPACSLTLEAGIRFPWSGGRHPVLDCLVTTPSSLIGIESKRFEPYRTRRASPLSGAYWRPVWGENMKGYESIRDSLRSEPNLYRQLDAAQLFKHAFALRTAVHRGNGHRGLRPVLFYVHAEPEQWPANGNPVDESAKARHREEIEQFEAAVTGDEVRFVSCTYRRLLHAWTHHQDGSIRSHAEAVAARFSP